MILLFVTPKTLYFLEQVKTNKKSFIQNCLPGNHYGVFEAPIPAKRLIFSTKLWVISSNFDKFQLKLECDKGSITLGGGNVPTRASRSLYSAHFSSRILLLLFHGSTVALVNCPSSTAAAVYFVFGTKCLSQMVDVVIVKIVIKYIRVGFSLRCFQ